LFHLFWNDFLLFFFVNNLLQSDDPIQVNATAVALYMLLYCFFNQTIHDNKISSYAEGSSNIFWRSNIHILWNRNNQLKYVCMYQKISLDVFQEKTGKVSNMINNHVSAVSHNFCKSYEVFYIKYAEQRSSLFSDRWTSTMYYFSPPPFA
jgi:hypothetical protein